MKRFPVLVAFHLLAIVSLCFIVAWTYEQSLAWTSAVFFAIAIALSFNLYRLHIRVLQSMSELLHTLPCYEGDQRLNEHRRSKETEHIADEINGILHRLQDRLVEGEVRRTYYETLLNRVDTAVLVCYPSGITEWHNQAAEKLLGANPRLSPDWLVPETEGRSVSHRHADGEAFELLLTCTRISIRGGERCLVALKNVKSLLEHNEMEAWQKLIRVLTHEIMNSITPIVSLSETLCLRAENEGMDGRLASLMLQSMQTIHRRSEGLLDFIENYRRLTRLPNPVPVPVSVDELKADMAQLFDSPALSFSSTAPNLSFTADRNQVEQLLINLIRNALEACQECSTPCVDVNFVQNPDASMRIEVCDNGQGILPEAMEKIFIPFFTTKARGSGIGLSLCKQIMALHRGFIRVASEPGKGTTFTLQFPASILNTHNTLKSNEM